MDRNTIRTIGRLAACLMLVVGFSMMTAGCAENKCDSSQMKQCSPDCKKACDKSACPKSAKCCGTDGKCCKEAKKCAPGCTKPCCKKA